VMTSKERDELTKIIKLRMRVAKASLDTLAADRRAEVEAQLSAIHKADSELWKDITEKADQAVKDADVQIAQICAQHGIPERFRPSLSLSWYGRGENAVKSRRDELHKLAFQRIEADKKAGAQLIEAWGAEKLSALYSSALTTDEAISFLESLPTPESLMPTVRITAELTNAMTPYERFLDAATRTS
jgi:hypothetical protein